MNNYLEDEIDVYNETFKKEDLTNKDINNKTINNCEFTDCNLTGSEFNTVFFILFFKVINP